MNIKTITVCQTLDVPANTGGVVRIVVGYEKLKARDGWHRRIVKDYLLQVIEHSRGGSCTPLRCIRTAYDRRGGNRSFTKVGACIKVAETTAVGKKACEGDSAAYLITGTRPAAPGTVHCSPPVAGCTYRVA